MIYVFYGEERSKALEAAKKIFRGEYEVVDAAEMEPAELENIFFGTTLFENKRKILIQDFFANKALLEKLVENPEFFETEHEIVLLSDAFDKRTAAAKELSKNSKVKIQEFKKPEVKVDTFFAFNVFDEATKNGTRAVKKLKMREAEESPYMMVGAWASKAQKNYLANPTEKNKRVLKELAKIDIMLKTTSFSGQPFVLLESFLARLKDL